MNGGGDSLSVRQMLDELVPAFDSQRQRGKTRFLGITAVGDTAALHKVIDARVFDSAQVSYNMLNPSAAAALPANYPAQDYGRLFDRIKAAGVGVVGIRVLAGGALSGSPERHPIASPPPEPIGSAMSYDADVARARRLMPLVAEGFAASLTEAAARLRSRIRRWARSWSAWQRRDNSRMRSPRFEKARCREPRSSACRRCSRRSPGSHVEAARRLEHET